MGKNIEFSNVNNDFQTRHSCDIKRMKDNDHLLIPADKSRKTSPNVQRYLYKTSNRNCD